MYIHLGNNHIIPIKDIVIIVNITQPLSEDLADVIEHARYEKRLVAISENGKEKSMIICTDKIYISPISSNTLYKRGALTNIIAS